MDLEKIISYNELVLRYNSTDAIPYKELLHTSEWAARRVEIISRDGNCCQKCGKIEIEEKPLFPGHLVKPRSLHVHHKYYVGTSLPWQYPDDALIALCQSCHYALHEQEKIPFYYDSLQSMRHYLTPCYRCNGAGHLVEYSYHRGGICFRCNGKMYDEWR